MRNRAGTVTTGADADRAGEAMTGVSARRARHHRRMPLRAGILTLACLLLCAAPAGAAFDVTAFEVTPATTAAGAHADVTIATSFTPYDAGAPSRPRNITFHLPPGLAGDPFATPRCAEADYRADACPAATKVGSVAATATAVITLLPVRQDVTGDLYNLQPAGSEPARLGAVLRPTGGLLGKLFVPTTISRARERRRPRLGRDRPAHRAERDPALHRADGVHAPGPPGRRDRPVHAQPDIVQAGDVDRRGHAVGGAGHDRREDQQLHADRTAARSASSRTSREPWVPAGRRRGGPSHRSAR